MFNWLSNLFFEGEKEYCEKIDKEYDKMCKIANEGDQIEYLGQQMVVVNRYIDAEEDLWVIETQWFGKNGELGEMEIYPDYWKYIKNLTKGKNE